MDLETGHYVLTSQPDGQGGEGTEINPDEASYSNNMSRALSEGNLQDHKILAFQQKPPKAKEGERVWTSACDEPLPEYILWWSLQNSPP